MKFSSTPLAFLATAILAVEQQPFFLPAETISQPLLGFGTWNLKISSENTTTAVSLAIQTGYQQIDCAAAYGNENEVGKGIADGLEKANLSRSDI
jgi:alcohol dehydrogenase (NADP+)